MSKMEDWELKEQMRKWDADLRQMQAIKICILLQEITNVTVLIDDKLSDLDADSQKVYRSDPGLLCELASWKTRYLDKLQHLLKQVRYMCARFRKLYDIDGLNKLSWAYASAMVLSESLQVKASNLPRKIVQEDLGKLPSIRVVRDYLVDTITILEQIKCALGEGISMDERDRAILEDKGTHPWETARLRGLYDFCLEVLEALAEILPEHYEQCLSRLRYFGEGTEMESSSVSFVHRRLDLDECFDKVPGESHLRTFLEMDLIDVLVNAGTTSAAAIRGLLLIQYRARIMASGVPLQYTWGHTKIRSVVVQVSTDHKLKSLR